MYLVLRGVYNVMRSLIIMLSLYLTTVGEEEERQGGEEDNY